MRRLFSKLFSPKLASAPSAVISELSVQATDREQKKIYIIGSLKNGEVRAVANKLRALGYEVFDDWQAAHPDADDNWRDYEKNRGRTYKEALVGHAARQVYEFDKRHLDDSDVAILLLPAGRSGHLELGYFVGQGKPGYILLDNPDRWDVMYQFAHGVFESFEDLENVLTSQHQPGRVVHED